METKSASPISPLNVT